MAVYSVTPTISAASAYADGDIIGGKLTIQFALSTTGLLTHIVVYDDDGKGAQLDFFFFNSDLSGTYTDNAAFAIDAADKSKYIGYATVSTTDYIDAGADKVGQKTPINLSLDWGLQENEDLFVVTVIRSIQTFTAIDDLRFDFGVL